MATLTNYVFLSAPGFWSGPFELINVTVPDKPPQPVGMFNVIETPNTSVWKSFRPSSETAIGLASVLNTQSVKGQINNVVGQFAKSGLPVQLTSPVAAKIVPWPLVPYFFQKPNAHSPMTMLISIYFTIHITTPWPASDADVTISFYAIPALVNGHLVAPIDGAWVHVSGGWPVSQSIADRVGTGAKAAIGSLQKLIDDPLSKLHGFTFSKIYLLPGRGNKLDGTWFDDADSDVVVGLVP